MVFYVRASVEAVLLEAYVQVADVDVLVGLGGLPAADADARLNAQLHDCLRLPAFAITAYNDPLHAEINRCPKWLFEKLYSQIAVFIESV